METLVEIPKVAESTRGTIKSLQALPFGQRMIRAGFKEVTDDNLMDRLGCTAANAGNKEKARLKAVSKANAANRILNKLRQGKRRWYQKPLGSDYVVKYINEWDDMDDEWEEYFTIKNNKGDLKRKRWSSCVRFAFRWDEWEVDFTKLEDYCEDKIPARCLKNVQKAKELGVKHLWVAHPTEKTPDPIIIATKGMEKHYDYYGDDTGTTTPTSPYYEVDMWE